MIIYSPKTNLKIHSQHVVKVDVVQIYQKNKKSSSK